MLFPHKSQWRRTLMFSLICFLRNGWVNNREAGDLRRYRTHYDVTVMQWWLIVCRVTYFSEVLINFHSRKKINLKMSSAKCPQFCPSPHLSIILSLDQEVEGTWQAIFRIKYDKVQQWIHISLGRRVLRYKTCYHIFSYLMCANHRSFCVMWVNSCKMGYNAKETLNSASKTVSITWTDFFGLVFASCRNLVRHTTVWHMCYKR